MCERQAGGQTHTEDAAVTAAAARRLPLLSRAAEAFELLKPANAIATPASRKQLNQCQLRHPFHAPPAVQLLHCGGRGSGQGQMWTNQARRWSTKLGRPVYSQVHGRGGSAVCVHESRKNRVIEGRGSAGKNRVECSSAAAASGLRQQC